MNRVYNHLSKQTAAILIYALIVGSAMSPLQVKADGKMSKEDIANSAKLNDRIDHIMTGKEDFALRPEDIIASAKISDRIAGKTIFDKYAGRFSEERKRLVQSLIEILKDPNSSNLNQSSAGYYLGQMHASEAVDILATKISLKFTDWPLHPLPPDSDYYPFVDDLIEIGTPAMPALIRNLAESDNAKVRELSLQVLYRIDGDKDISQLRLQKALKAEKDSQKQARLQAALKSFSEIK